MKSGLKWYTVNIPVVKGGSLDRRIQAICKDEDEGADERVVQMAVVTGVVDHMHRNLGILERALEQP